MKTQKENFKYDYYSILTQLGYNLRDMGREWRAIPIYRDSNNPNSLRIFKDTGYFVDYGGDNQRGNFFYLVKITLGVKTDEEVNKFLKGNNFSVISITGEKRPVIKKSGQKFDKSCLSSLLSDNSYWINRGVDEGVLRYFQGGVATKGKMIKRYVFPIFNVNREIIGFSGRCLQEFDNERRKELNRPKWKHLGEVQDFVYPAFLNLKKIQEQKEVILVESIGDVLALFTAGIYNVLCFFGTNLGRGIIKTCLSCDVQRIILATNNEPDNNSVGNKAAKKAQKTLEQYFDSTQILVALPQVGKDFGEQTVEQNKDWYARLQNSSGK